MPGEGGRSTRAFFFSIAPKKSASEREAKGTGEALQNDIERSSDQLGAGDPVRKSNKILAEGLPSRNRATRGKGKVKVRREKGGKNLRGGFDGKSKRGEAEEEGELHGGNCEIESTPL